MSVIVRKIGSASLAASALLIASWGVQADDNSPTAQVHITAQVVGHTCTPSWSSGNSMQVDMGKIDDKLLKSPGDVGASKPFVLSLTNCDSGVSKVIVTALGKPDSADSKAFANTAVTGAADGTAVTLFGGADQSTQLTPDASSSAEYDVKGGAATMSFLAKLERSAAVGKDANKDGAVESTATLSVSYE